MGARQPPRRSPAAPGRGPAAGGGGSGHVRPGKQRPRSPASSPPLPEEAAEAPSPPVRSGERAPPRLTVPAGAGQASGSSPRCDRPAPPRHGRLKHPSGEGTRHPTPLGPAAAGSSGARAAPRLRRARASPNAAGPRGGSAAAQRPLAAGGRRTPQPPPAPGPPHALARLRSQKYFYL